MGVTQAVKQVAGDVVETVKSTTAASAQQVAKTPLDLLEELLGQSPGTPKPDAEKPESEAAPSSAQGNPQELKQKEEADEQFRVQRAQQLHDQITQSSQGYYEQKKQMEEQQKQAQEQTKQQEKFQIENLEKQKQEDFALRAAKDAASAEKRVGAG